MLWPTLWILLLLSSALKVSAVLYVIAKDGTKTVLRLDSTLNIQQMREWLQTNGLVLKPDLIDFSEATETELERLPMEFYKKHATGKHLVQIWNLPSIDNSDSEHIIAILRIAKRHVTVPHSGAVTIRQNHLQPRRRPDFSSSSPSTGSSPLDGESGDRHVQSLDTFLATGFSASEDFDTAEGNGLIFDFFGAP